MKVLITRQRHRLYDQVGEVVVTGRLADGDPVYVLRVGDDYTYVREGWFKVIKRQEGRP